MIKYLVIDLNDPTFHYIVDDLTALIKEMYEIELLTGESLSTVSEWFNENHKVFEVEGSIKEGDYLPS